MSYIVAPVHASDSAVVPRVTPVLDHSPEVAEFIRLKLAAYERHHGATTLNEFSDQVKARSSRLPKRPSRLAPLYEQCIYTIACEVNDDPALYASSLDRETLELVAPYLRTATLAVLRTELGDNAGPALCKLFAALPAVIDEGVGTAGGAASSTWRKVR